jgi:hypothetical protein
MNNLLGKRDIIWNADNHGVRGAEYSGRGHI